MSNAAILSPLAEVLDGKEFVIPRYQRGYAWKEAQWSALWNDLDNMIRLDAATHFVGMLMLRTQDSRTEVVDGQQRLTTIMLLANALREASGTTRIEYPLTFSGNEDLQNHFDFYASGIAGAAARISSDHASSYALNIGEAARFFKAAATSLDPDKAAKYLDVLLERFHLFVLEIPQKLDIHVAFETLNNRGLQLSKMELLKNRLIYLCAVLKSSGSLTGAAVGSEVHKAWRTIYSALGRTPANSTDDDAFLDAHATIYYGKTREKNWLRTKLFNSEFSIRNPALSLEDIQKYVRSLERASLWWSHLHEPRKLPRDHQRWLDRLDRAMFANVKPLLLSAYMRASEASIEALIDPSKLGESTVPIAKLMTNAERFAVIVFRLMGNNGSRGRAYLDGCAYSLLVQGRKDPGDLPGLSAMEAAEAITYVADYLHAWATNKDLDEDEPAADPRFDWSGEFSKSDYAIRAVEQRFGGHQATGYYGWHFTRLALYNYEESFRRDGHLPQKLSWGAFSFDETVEHIYPQTADSKGGWDKAIPIDGRSNRNGKLRMALVNSLGNLLFLSRSDNSSASNRAYSGSPGSKQERYSKNGYSAAQVARTFDKWDSLAIAARGITILKKCEERWDFTMVDEPHSYMSYLPLLFGASHQAIADGKTGKKITERSLAKVVDKLLADFGK